ncbi:ATP-binding cassette domain-containing protein [Lacicoccus qingdaonensis]|uniref:ABC-2 type transport system ATP-binding protein n=1 Tax=Lacicoccus qingdaonensis TaxID=576118 RepID=A0A1G9FUL9_9BACL|nr:ATP-binding cassette domain-containing protein [Salinicoccus qingdaonensis]SDK92099.1 ABC-2 type transport system ATP-binding protein [Salinicoccus qingdaonensis]
MINIKNLSFAYDKKNILKDVNLSETEPLIVGLWGRNGSGKTTLMKILSGLEKPGSGIVEVDGVVPYNNIEAMHHVLFMQEDHPYSDLWDVNDALGFASDFNRNWDQTLADELVYIFQLPRNQKIRKFSKGMNTMITIVIGLASKSPVTIFDEPSNGLDAHMRKQFYDMTVLEERKLGKQLKVMVDEAYTENLKMRAEANDLTIEKAPFQDYLVNLTKRESNINAFA